MRVIAGDFKGRRLETPVDNNVRPTSDKVKEAMFSILMYDVEDAVVCDLFSGTGGLGIEALSRGAKKCYFSDQSKNSIKLLKENIYKCGAEDRSSIIFGDYLSALDRIKEKLDIIILDPPYGNGMELKAMKKIAEKRMLSDDGIIVVEHAASDVMENEVAGFKKYKEKKYGKVVLSLYIW